MLKKDEILKEFKNKEYVILPELLTPEEVQFLNQLVDSDIENNKTEWKEPNQGARATSHILMRHPELDRFIRSDKIISVIDEILGGEVRFGQMDFRDVPKELSENSQMGFHRDVSFYGTVGGKLWDPKNPYVSTYVCVIYYLKDVHDCCPCFCVAPNTHEFRKVEDAKEAMGETYREDDIRGSAGTAVMYNITTHHARKPGLDHCIHGRRTMHVYYSRESNSPLTDWVRVPEELSLSDDEATRDFYSQWTPNQITYAREHFRKPVPGYYPRMIK